MIFDSGGIPAGSGRRSRPRLACLALRASRGPGVGTPANGWPARLPGKPSESPVAGGSARGGQGAARGLPGSQKLDSANVQQIPIFSLFKKNKTI